MSKISWWMLAFLSITGTLCAQSDNNNTLSGADKVFELPDYSLAQRFRFDLGKGNLLMIEVGEGSNLDRFSNIDSLLLVFLADMKTFRDSLADPLTTKRIDYVMDLSGHKKVRLRQSRTPDARFLLGDGEPAALKMEQDSIHILLSFVAPAGVKAGQAGKTRYDRLTLVINRYDELESFVTAGLNSKVKLLQTNRNHNYSFTNPDRYGNAYLRADRSITAMNMTGDKNALTSAELSALAGVTAQTYTNYFTPSFSLGFAISVRQGANKNTVGFTWEPLFFFPVDAQGHQQTLHNDFLVFSYSYNRSGKKEEEKPNRVINIGPDFSLGWLVNREGGYFQKHSFRFSAARLTLMHNYVNIEPCIYFHDFLRNVTPGIKISLGELF
jgi:hypothetical protein